MGTKGFVSLLLLGALPFGCSQKEAAPSPVSESSREVATNATVQSVDLARRRLTLTGPYGNTITCQVDERVRNLDQIKQGDVVTLTYLESTALQVVRKAEPEDGEDTVILSASSGEKPAGETVRQGSVTAEVVGLDKARGALTLKDCEGECRTILVRHPERLAPLKIGDLLSITYSEALAVSVEPAVGEVR